MSERERPGRYPRTSSGLIAALLVTVLAVVAFLLLRGLFDTDYEDQPTNLDYLGTVASLQAAGFDAVYPPALPDGWIARAVDVVPGDRPAFGLSLLTDDEKFVGIRQEDTDVDDLLDTYVDKNSQQGGVLTVSGSVSPSWQGWSDDGGDHAFTATVGETTVIVFGDAPVADLEGVVGSLTDLPLSSAAATPVVPSTPATR